MQISHILIKYSRSHTICPGNLRYLIFNILRNILTKQDPIFRCLPKTCIEQKATRQRNADRGPFYAI